MLHWVSSLIDVAFSIYMEILQVALLHNYLVVFAHLFISRLKECHVDERRYTFIIFANMTLHSWVLFF